MGNLLHRDLQHPGWMYLKALLLAAILVTCLVAALFENRLAFRALFLVLLVWSSARLYYFAFYVIECYIDPGYRFAGIGSAFRHLWRKRRRKLR
ncbi:MAG: hypothetical protein ACFB21_06765 [Opitutales bacterium]